MNIFGRCAMVKRILCLMAVFSIFTLCRAEEITQVEEKNFKLKPGSLIFVAADEGDILVSSWAKDNVYLKMTKRAWGRSRQEAEHLLENVTVQIYQNDNKLAIKEVERDRRDFRLSDLFDQDFWESGGYGASIDFELKVPYNINLKISGDEGDVEIREVKGEINIEVDEGDVTGSKILSEDVQIYVDEGDIYLSELVIGEKGLLNIETDEGDIVIRGGNLGEIDIESDEGDILIDTNSLAGSWVSSDEGDIEVSFQPLENGAYRFETDEGDIEIALPEDSNIDVQLQASEGRIDTDFGLEVYDRDEGEALDGVIGKNLSYLKAYTDEGYIVLLKKTKGV